jgi:hypothetical protein
MRTNNVILVNNADASVTIDSPAYSLDQVWGISLQAVFSGSPVGTVKLQGSDDSGVGPTSQYPNAPIIVNWTDIVNSSNAVTGAMNVVWNIADPFQKWIRLVYTPASGTGNLTLTINSKGN